MKKTSLFALLAVAGSTSAFATVRETASFAGPINSNGRIGGAANAPAVSFVATGLWDDAGTPTAYNVGQLVFAGTLTNGTAGSFFPNEASVLVTPPSGTPFVISPRQGGTSPSTVANAVTIPVGAVTTAGTWTFTFFELFDDGTTITTGNGIDNIWSNVSIGFDDAVPASNAQPGSQANFALSNVLSDGLATAGFVTNALTVSGSPNTTTQIRISGTATSLRGPATDTTGSAVGNLRFSIVRPDGTTVSPVVTPTFTGIGVTATSASSANFVATINLGAALSENGTWTLRSFQAVDIPGGPDVGMRDVMISFLPPPPPPANTSITLVANTLVTDTVTVTAPQAVKWYSFTLANDVSAALNRALRIDNETSTTAPVNDTAMTIFNSDGSIRLTDTLDGTDSLASFSFGVDNGAAPGNGAAYNGRDGAILAGTYYVAVTVGTSPTAAFPFSVTGASATATASSLTTRFLYRDPVVAAPSATPITLTEGAFASGTGSISTAGGVQWFSFTTPAGLVSTGALDIDVEGTALAAANDTDIALYGPGGGALIASNEDGGTDQLSQLSFGSGRRNAPGNGLRFLGQNGTVGVAGTILPNTLHYLAVAGGNAATHTGGFATAGGVNTGSVTARVRVYSSDAPTEAVPAPSSQNLGTFTSTVSPTELVVSDTNNVTNGTTIKWYSLTTAAVPAADPTLYLDIDTDDTAPTTTSVIGGIMDTEIALYRANGERVAEDDDGGNGYRSALSFGNVGPRPAVSAFVDTNGTALPRAGQNGALLAGTYYLGVTTYNSTNNATDFDIIVDTTRAATVGNRITSIRTNLSLPPTQCTLSDVAGANQSIGSDNALTADDIIVFLSWYFANDIRADVAGPNQSTTPDGQFSADDIIVFLARYFAGC